MLDIFLNNAFSLISLTSTLNKVPFVPGRAGQVIDWGEQGITALNVAIEEQDGVLQLINPSPRGSPGDTVKKPGRRMRVLRVPHYQIDDGIYADEVQGVREFGTEDQLKTVQSVVSQRMTDHVNLRMDPTLEYQRIGALKGNIINADGSQLYNLYTEFGVTAAPVINYDLTNASPASGAIRLKIATSTRYISGVLGAVPFRDMYAFAGDNFFDTLVSSAEVRQTYLNQTEASQLRSGIPTYGTFRYGDITWENYRGGVNGVPFIDPNEAIIFPVGVPGLWKTVYAPADYIETVNTVGLPRYAKQFRMQNDKGINMEVQMNALSYCTRPNVIQRVTR